MLSLKSSLICLVLATVMLGLTNLGLTRAATTDLPESADKPLPLRIAKIKASKKSSDNEGKRIVFASEILFHPGQATVMKTEIGSDHKTHRIEIEITTIKSAEKNGPLGYHFHVNLIEQISDAEPTFSRPQIRTLEGQQASVRIGDALEVEVLVELMK